MFGTLPPFGVRWSATTETRRARIRRLNDVFRRSIPNATTVLAPSMLALNTELRARAIREVAKFDGFTPEIDPDFEHDFGRFRIGNYKVFWKIEYYDRDVRHGSEDPADPERTTRVLTIMLADEY